MLKYIFVVCLILSACRVKKDPPSGEDGVQDTGASGAVDVSGQTPVAGGNLPSDQKPPKPLSGTKTEGATSPTTALKEPVPSLNGVITKRVGQFLFVSSDLKGVCGRGTARCAGGGKPVCFLSQQQSSVERQMDSYKKNWAGTSVLLKQSRVMCVKNHSRVERVFPSCEDGTQPVCGLKKINISLEYQVACAALPGESAVFHPVCLTGQPVCSQQGRAAYCANTEGYVFSDEPVPVGMKKQKTQYALRCEKSPGGRRPSSHLSQTGSEPYCVKKP